MSAIQTVLNALNSCNEQLRAAQRGAPVAPILDKEAYLSEIRAVVDAIPRGTLPEQFDEACYAYWYRAFRWLADRTLVEAIETSTSTAARHIAACYIMRLARDPRPVDSRVLAPALAGNTVARPTYRATLGWSLAIAVHVLTLRSGGCVRYEIPDTPGSVVAASMARHARLDLCYVSDAHYDVESERPGSEWTAFQMAFNSHKVPPDNVCAYYRDRDGEDMTLQEIVEAWEVDYQTATNAETLARAPAAHIDPILDDIYFYGLARWGGPSLSNPHIWVDPGRAIEEYGMDKAHVARLLGNAPSGRPMLVAPPQQLVPTRRPAQLSPEEQYAAMSAADQRKAWHAYYEYNAARSKTLAQGIPNTMPLPALYSYLSKHTMLQAAYDVREERKQSRKAAADAPTTASTSTSVVAVTRPRVPVRSRESVSPRPAKRPQPELPTPIVVSDSSSRDSTDPDTDSDSGVVVVAPPVVGARSADNLSQLRMDWLTIGDDDSDDCVTSDTDDD